MIWQSGGKYGEYVGKGQKGENGLRAGVCVVGGSGGSWFVMPSGIVIYIYKKTLTSCSFYFIFYGEFLAQYVYFTLDIYIIGFEKIKDCLENVRKCRPLIAYGGTSFYEDEAINKMRQTTSRYV